MTTNWHGAFRPKHHVRRQSLSLKIAPFKARARFSYWNATADGLTVVRPGGMVPAVGTASRVGVVIVLVLSLGLHWAVLQTVAWTGMMVRYSQGTSFAAALQKTFDGKHPCRLCQVIKRGQAEEQRQKPKQELTVKLELGLPGPSEWLCRAPAHETILAPDLYPTTRSDAPPKPRPRLLPRQG